MEVVEVGEKNLRLDHVVEGRTSCLERLFKILEDVCALQLDVGAVEGKAFLLACLRRNAGSIVARDLTSGEDVIAQGKSRAVVRERSRSCRLDDLVLKTTARAVADEIDFHERIFDEQAGAADRSARRRHPEIAFPNRIETVEVVEIGQKNLRLHHLVERGTGRL